MYMYSHTRSLRESRPNGRHLLLALLAGVFLSAVAQQFVDDLLSINDAEINYDAVSATSL